MENFNLQVAVHYQTRAMDKLVLKWAFSEKIVVSNSELERYKKEKINFFAGYLFPEISTANLEWIMKMFFWLFVLDDQLDKGVRSESRILISALRVKRSFNFDPKYKCLFKSWERLMQSSPGRDNPEWQAGWDIHWSTFLNGIQWELNNKYFGRTPNIEDYKYYRPHLSGVFLALHYLKLDLEVVPSCASTLLEHKIARWICLGNDLVSAEKEESIGDFHNELFLLSKIVSRRQAQRHLEDELHTLHRHIQKLQAEVLRQSPECKEWMSRLNLLMGGCVYWSNDVTVRYESYLNGVNKT